ncbi:POK6 protein, partial [Indicator maculatus]|nr:POK6 protein [Indicator maculatus]
SNHHWIMKPRISLQPLTDAITVFTDAGKKSMKAAATWKQDERWENQIIFAQPNDSLQTLELAAVVWALGNWLHVPVNIVSDSMYVVGIVQRIEDAMIKEVSNDRLSELLW